MQLRKQADELSDHDATVIVVQREDESGADGLKKTAAATKADFVFLNDLGAKATAGYSKDSFTTYIIDSKGVVRKDLSGTKTNRPSAEKIVEGVQEMARPAK